MRLLNGLVRGRSLQHGYCTRRRNLCKKLVLLSKEPNDFIDLPIPEPERSERQEYGGTDEC